MPSILLFLKSSAFKYLAVALLLAGAFYAIYSMGENAVQAKWDLQVAKTQEEIGKLNIQIAELKAKSNVVTVNTEIKYVDRIKTVTVKGDTIIKYVDKYIAAEADAACVIPKNFVLLLDSAAKNALPIVGEAQ